jgi:hypothetical protein
MSKRVEVLARFPGGQFTVAREGSVFTMTIPFAEVEGADNLVNHMQKMAANGQVVLVVDLEAAVDRAATHEAPRTLQ